MGRNAEGADEVLNELALVLVVERLSRRADDLEDDLDGTFLLIAASDSQRDALAFAVHAENDELARLGFSGNEGRLNLHLGDGWIQSLFSHDFVHIAFSFCFLININIAACFSFGGQTFSGAVRNIKANGDMDVTVKKCCGRFAFREKRPRKAGEARKIPRLDGSSILQRKAAGFVRQPFC